MDWRRNSAVRSLPRLIEAPYTSTTTIIFYQAELRESGSTFEKYSSNELFSVAGSSYIGGSCERDI
jgi:hypothetical protein